MGLKKRQGTGLKKTYEFEPDPDMFVSEILCEKCKHSQECDPGEDFSQTCAAYKALEKEMP